jgi:hypothetical protein
MTYKLIKWTPELDLTEFYSEANRRGYENNNSQKTMFDCFLNEREWAGWMLEYNGKFIGGVCIHSFDDVMGPNSYRILARTCTFTSETHKPWPHTKQTIIVEQQCCATQFFIPISIQWAGEGKRFFATSNANPMGSQQRVNNLWFPMQAELGRFSWVKEAHYRGCDQNVWELNVDEWKKSLAMYEIWPCEFPSEDPRTEYVKL